MLKDKQIIYKDDAFTSTKDKWKVQHQRALKLSSSKSADKRKVGNRILDFLENKKSKDFGVEHVAKTETKVVSYRGGRGLNKNLGKGSAGTEGKGLYVSSSATFAEQFGDVRAVTHSKPKNPLVVKNEPLPLLHEEYPIFDSIKDTDSEWIKLNKQAAINTGNTKPEGFSVSEVSAELTKLAKNEGYDAIKIESGGDKWTVLIDESLYKDTKVNKFTGDKKNIYLRMPTKRVQEDATKVSSGKTVDKYKDVILYRGAPSSDNPLVSNKYTSKLGSSFSTDVKHAETFSSMPGLKGDVPTVRAYKLKSDAKVMILTEADAIKFDAETAKNTEAVEAKLGRVTDSFEVPDAMVEYAKSKGYDAIDTRVPRYGAEQEIRVLNPSKLELIKTEDKKRTKEIELDKALKKEAHKVQKEKNIGILQYRQIARETTGNISTTEMSNVDKVEFIKAMQNTDATKNFIVNNIALKAQDTDSEILSSDIDIAKTQKSYVNNQERRVRGTNAKVKLARSKGKEYNHFRWYAPERVAMADFEDKTSIPIVYKDHQIKRTARITAHNTKASFGKMLMGIPNDKPLNKKEVKNVITGIQDEIANTSIAGNERIANWLFSAETREKVQYSMTAKELQMAKRLEFIAQESPMAAERMEESLRRWVTRKKAPYDMRKFDKNQQKAIFEGAKRAKDEGRLKEFTQELFYNGVRFGLREYYYPSLGESTDAVLDYLKGVSGGPLEGATFDEATPPALIGKETRQRKGKGTPKAGSVYSNFLNSYERVAVRNSIANDLEELYRRFNMAELSPTDKEYLNQLYSKVLLKGELLLPPYQGISKGHSLFWRTHLSFVTNPFGAIRAATRNSLQLISEGGQVAKLSIFYKTSGIIAARLAKGDSLYDIDQELGEDYTNSFPGYISQKGSQYREMMFIDLGKKAKAESITSKTTEFMKMVLDKTGFLYVGADTFSRAAVWPSVYKTIKDTANDYHEGKINYKKFLSITNIDTMMKDSQYDTARNLLVSRDTRSLAKYVADTYTFDMFRGYAEEERAGIERTREQRALVGIYTYPRGVFDLFYNRGLRHLYEGVKTGDYARARRGAANVAKGIVGRGTANAILIAMGFGSMYSIYRTFYTPLQPAVNIVSDTATKISMILYKLSENEITEEQATKAIAEITYRGMDDVVHVLPELEGAEEISGRRSRGTRERRSRQ